VWAALGISGGGKERVRIDFGRISTRPYATSHCRLGQEPGRGIMSGRWHKVRGREISIDTAVKYLIWHPVTRYLSVHHSEFGTAELVMIDSHGWATHRLWLWLWKNRDGS